MPAYAPSNAQTVTVNPPHGCGRPHHRDGATVWAVDCPACHPHLTGLLGWGATLDQLPETPDEKRVREAAEEKGVRERDRVAVDAINSLKGMPGALEALTAFLVTQGQPAVAEVVRCASGHANPVAVKFCGECGAPMGTLVPGAVAPDAPAALEPAPEAARAKRARDMRLDELQAAARERGLPHDGTRAQLIARLKEAR